MIAFMMMLMAQTAKSASISFVVVGHLYPMLNSSQKFERLLDKIQILNPDYVFVLGDSMLQKEYIYLKFVNTFGNKVYFTPGNNEIVDGSLENYYENVGYNNKVIDTESVRFVLLNSLQSITDIKNFLQNTFNRELTKKMQILLTHHRIWDDTLTSMHPYEHDKSFYFKEIFPLIKDKVNVIFSGNSKRQYFSDSKNFKVGQNMNNILWLDQVGEISLYSVGTGDAFPKLGFVLGEIEHNRLYIAPQHINYVGVDPLPISMIIPHSNSKPPSKTINNNIRPPNRNIEIIAYNYIKSLSKKYIMLLGIMIGAFISLFVMYFIHKSKK